MKFYRNPGAGLRVWSYSRRIGTLIATLLVWLLPWSSRATIPLPGEGDPPSWLNAWSFNDTNTWESFRGEGPLAFTNLSSSPLGNWQAVVVDHAEPAWLQYRVLGADGTNNLTVNRGTLMFWFAPFWSGTNAGGTGPGDWARLLEVGAYTTNANYGWWSLYTDPAGVNLYFAAQTNGATAVYLTKPIEWTTNRWHLLALTYSATNASLYIDGELVTNNAAGVTLWPGADVLTNGFFLGSDNTGIAQARGMFDDLVTYNYPLPAEEIAATFGWYQLFYYFNPANFANLMSAVSTPPQYGPTFVAISGIGSLQWQGTNATGCVTHSNVWLTNVVAGLVNSNATGVTFAIAGGSNGVPYDVFGNSVLAPASDVSKPWAWLGRGYHCNTYALSNLPPTSAFLVLGQPTDSDLDGLTDAYERLVSKTDPANPDTDGDGLLDGWEVLQGLDPKANDAAQSGRRSNYTYDGGGWLHEVSGVRAKDITLDAEGNVREVAP